MKDISTYQIFRGLLSTPTDKIKLKTTNEIHNELMDYQRVPFIWCFCWSPDLSAVTRHTCRASVYLLQSINCSRKTFPKQGWYTGLILSQAITLFVHFFFHWYYAPPGTWTLQNSGLFWNLIVALRTILSRGKEGWISTTFSYCFLAASPSKPCPQDMSTPAWIVPVLLFFLEVVSKPNYSAKLPHIWSPGPIFCIQAQQQRLYHCSWPPLITVVRTELAFSFLFQINIERPARKAITRNTQDLTQSCFDKVQRIIYRYMERDSYPCFLESQFYQKLKHNLQTNGNNSMGNWREWLKM